MTPTLVTTIMLAEALGITRTTVIVAVDRGDASFAGFSRTPGGEERRGHLRWPVERAGEIVREHGCYPPTEWRLCALCGKQKTGTRHVCAKDLQ